MQPTAARSPTLNFETLEPTRVTRPRISCPGTTGNCVKPHSLRAKCRSLWQTPQNRMSISTSYASGCLRSMFIEARGDVAEVAPKALVGMGEDRIAQSSASKSSPIVARASLADHHQSTAPSPVETTGPPKTSPLTSPSPPPPLLCRLRQSRLHSSSRRPRGRHQHLAVQTCRSRGRA